MSLDLSPLKDEYGPCERLIVECYLHKEDGVNPEEITVADCQNCAYNLHQGKPFKPKTNELENKVNHNDRI